MSEKFNNLINGVWKDSISGNTFENRNPAKGKEDVMEAVAAAKAAFEKWRLVPAPKRGDVLKVVGDRMFERKDEIAHEMTREMGKVFAETKGDVQEGIDTAYYAASEGRRLFGLNAPSELPNKMNLSFRVPIGVGGFITPWNFPMAIPTWKMFPALVCGNTCVFKPAELTPKTATILVEIIDAAMREVLGKDYIPGVINIVHGKGRIVGEAMISHPDVDLISFTGSTEVGKRINEVAGGSLKRVSLELGGKNAQIVMNDADQELALEAVLWGAFGTTGQRCTATSRLILHKDIYYEFVDKLIARVRKLKLGYGNDNGVEVGPCVSEAQRESVNDYVKIGLNEDNAVLAAGGEYAREGELEKGWFYQPTIFTEVKPGMRIEQEEIFGPVLSVIKCEDLTDAINILNGTPYGLSSSIFTKNINDAFVAIRDIKAGITYVNGETEWKAVYIDYSGKLQRAQIDNY